MCYPNAQSPTTTAQSQCESSNETWTAFGIFRLKDLEGGVSIIMLFLYIKHDSALHVKITL